MDFLVGSLTIFLTQMIALSVASERVTETVKLWVKPAIANWNAAHSAALIQLIAIVSGLLVVVFSGHNPLSVPNPGAPFNWSNRLDWLNCVASGLLVSGGSAFWNHVLDILKATKVDKEQAEQEDDNKEEDGLLRAGCSRRWQSNTALEGFTDWQG